jgi:hypothetical protein
MDFQEQGAGLDEKGFQAGNLHGGVRATSDILPFGFDLTRPTSFTTAGVDIPARMDGGTVSGDGLTQTTGVL